VNGDSNPQVFFLNNIDMKLISQAERWVKYFRMNGIHELSNWYH
jgi:hypothetical protein